MDRILGLPSPQQNVGARAEGVPGPVTSPAREEAFHPVPWSGSHGDEPQPLPFAAEYPEYPRMALDPDKPSVFMRSPARRSPKSAAAPDRGVVPEVLQNGDGPWLPDDKALHGRVVTAEVRSGIWAGPAGTMQFLTAVIVVNDAGAGMSHPLGEVAIGVARLLETLGRSVMTVNADAIPEPKAAKGKARSITRRAPEVSAETKAVRKRTQRGS